MAKYLSLSNVAEGEDMPEELLIICGRDVWVADAVGYFFDPCKLEGNIHLIPKHGSLYLVLTTEGVGCWDLKIVTETYSVELKRQPWPGKPGEKGIMATWVVMPDFPDEVSEDGIFD